MSSYEKFAQVYDKLMQDVPYDQYVEWIKTHAPSNAYPKLLDVGCGTGTLSLLFYQAGYEVSGIDLSEEMLTIANDRMQSQGVFIPFYQMSMDEIEGFEDMDIIAIPIDSINYLSSDDAVIETLRCSYAALRIGGQLVFDVHSLYKMNEIFMDSPFTYDDGEILYVWHTEEGEVEHSIYHQMTFFVKDMKTGLYERFDEEHFQRTFPIDTYIEWLKEIGFSKILISADFSENAPKANSERIFIRAIK